MSNLIYAAKIKNYDLTLHYDDGKVTSKGIYVKESFSSKLLEENKKGYGIKIISLDGEELYSKKFKFALILSEGIILNKTDRHMAIPYYDYAKEIQVFDQRNLKILTIPVTAFTDDEILRNYGIEYVSKPKQNKIVFIIIGIVVLLSIIVALTYKSRWEKKK